jgi:hypothetical protein
MISQPLRKYRIPNGASDIAGRAYPVGGYIPLEMGSTRPFIFLAN